MKNNDIQKQLAKLRRSKKLLWLGILFLVLIILWILVSLFATTKTSKISQEQMELSKSFVPRLESKVFDEISGKRIFSNEELASFSIFVLGQDEANGNSSLIDITIVPDATNSTTQPAQLTKETDNEGISEVSVATTSTSQVDLSTPENASRSANSPPPAVKDFLDFVSTNY